MTPIFFKTTIYISVKLAVLSIFLLGCASTYQYTYPGHKTFTEDNISKLSVGMSSEEIRTIFGDPDEVYTAEFGQNTDEVWTGKVWLYFTELDTQLKYAKRYKKNMFVFYPPEGEMTLNHWKIEE
jgi:hypothetical protein